MLFWISILYYMNFSIIASIYCCFSLLCSIKHSYLVVFSFISYTKSSMTTNKNLYRKENIYYVCFSWNPYNWRAEIEEPEQPFEDEQIQDGDKATLVLLKDFHWFYEEYSTCKKLRCISMLVPMLMVVFVSMLHINTCLKLSHPTFNHPKPYKLLWLNYGDTQW